MSNLELNNSTSGPNLMTPPENAENVTAWWVVLVSTSLPVMADTEVPTEEDTGNSSLLLNQSVETSPPASVEEFGAERGELEAGATLHTLMAVRVLLALLGGVFCALVLRALARRGGRRQGDAEVTSQWCVRHVIALDLLASLRQVYSAAVDYFRSGSGNVRGPYCVMNIVLLHANYFTSLPTVMALFTLGLDQLLAVVFPFAMRLRCHGTKTKKVLYSCIIWSPSFAFSAASLIRNWVEGNFGSCVAFTGGMFSNTIYISFFIIAMAFLDVIIYLVLIAKVSLHTLRNKLHQVAESEAARRQRRLAVIFCVVFWSSVIFWMPPYVVLATSESCMANEVCRVWYREIWSSVQIFFQLNFIFDPLFIAWRFLRNRNVPSGKQSGATSSAS